MASETCAICNSRRDLQWCKKCKSVLYCGRDHQKRHWSTHKFFCLEKGEPPRYIRGTRVKYNQDPCPNPLDPNLCHPSDRDGSSSERPLQSFLLFKHEKSSYPKVRLIKPGKNTPFINLNPDRDPKETEYPYEGKTNQLVSLDDGKYRHIASFTIEELTKMGWDGAMYSGKTYPGVWVPFVDGYDSDPSHEYEGFNINIAKKRGTVGINDVGKYMATAKGLVKLITPHIP